MANQCCLLSLTGHRSQLIAAVQAESPADTSLGILIEQARLCPHTTGPAASKRRLFLFQRSDPAILCRLTSLALPFSN